MKKTLLWAYSALLLLYLLPLAPRVGQALSARTPADPQSSSFPASENALPPTEGDAPPPRTLLVKTGTGVEEMAMQDYLFGVLAAEMPASFPEEALKAQAVAARTYALYCAASHKHADADVCTDPGCCQAWLGNDELRQRWGADCEQNAARIRSAVEETAEQTLRYQGEPVFAAFHSSSAGLTESSGAVWSPQPYLVSVSSPETAGDVPGYISTLRCAALDFRDVILSAYPEADFSGPTETWIGELRRDESGRVESLTLGGAAIPGTALRRLFSLRSTAFSLVYEEGSFLFTVTGYGHGVGMSQYGAMVMARDGADYVQILAHYYPGTVLTTDPS